MMMKNNNNDTFFLKHYAIYSPSCTPFLDTVHRVQKRCTLVVYNKKKNSVHKMSCRVYMVEVNPLLSSIFFFHAIWHRSPTIYALQGILCTLIVH